MYRYRIEKSLLNILISSCLLCRELDKNTDFSCKKIKMFIFFLNWTSNCRRVMLNSLVTNFMCWRYLSVPTTFVVRLLSVCTYVVHFYNDHVIMVISTPSRRCATEICLNFEFVVKFKMGTMICGNLFKRVPLFSWKKNFVGYILVSHFDDESDCGVLCGSWLSYFCRDPKIY